MTSLALRMTVTAALMLLAACNPATMGGNLLGNSAAPAPQVQAQQAQVQQAQEPVSQRKVDLAQYVSEAPIAEAAFSADGSVLATVHKRADAPYLGLWDLTRPDAPAIRTAKLGTGGGLGKTFILSPDGRTITLRRGEKDELALVDLATYRTVRPLKLGFPRDQIVGGAFSPDGNTLALISHQYPASGLHLIDVASGKPRLFRESHGYKALTGNYSFGPWVTFSPDGRFILCGLIKEQVVPGTPPKRHPLAHGALLYEAARGIPLVDFGLSDGSPRYTEVKHGAVLPDSATAILLGWEFSAFVNLPGGAEEKTMNPGTGNMFARMSAASGERLGLVLGRRDNSGTSLWIGHYDDGRTLFLRYLPIGPELPLTMAVNTAGEWLVAMPSGLKRFPALPPEADRAALALVEARELAEVGFPDEAYQLISRALDDDWRVVRRKGMDIVLPHSPLLAGQLELERWRLMRAEGEADAVWPLFGFGYLAVQAGHPQVVAQAAAELRRAGDLGTALAGYLDALVLAARGDVEGGYRLALAAKRGLKTADFDSLTSRIKDHAQAWQPLYADRAKLGFVIGVDEKDLPETPQRSVAMTPYIDIDGNRVGPGAAPPAARSPAPSAATAAPAAGPVVLE
ncbi:MAG: hypothetical protein RBS99_14930 [Rhodospirillales bacterium]|jgi:hypothetical protein|nr:hypothetical protein [Rhodospirillales bacterium]